MKNIVEETLSGLIGYLLEINRNASDGYYELKIAFPDDWVFEGLEGIITCELLEEISGAQIITIKPEKESLAIDILIEYAKAIIQLNKDIISENELFKKKVEEQKKILELEKKEMEAKRKEKLSAFKSDLNSIKEPLAPKPNKALNTKDYDNSVTQLDVETKMDEDLVNELKG